MSVTIRPATSSDLKHLHDIEIRSGQVFRGIGMAYVSEMPGISVEDFAAANDRGELWVADLKGHIVGFALAERRDGLAHLSEVSVVPEQARMGIGTKLINVVEAWARDIGSTCLTLTTFRDVPWNAPYYTKLGFEECNAADLGPQHETAHQNGKKLFPDHERIVMRKSIT